MGQFLYFRQNATEADVSRQALQSSPLGLPLRDLLRSPRLFDERVVINPVHNNGPGGHAGLLVNIGDRSLQAPFVPGVHRDHQRWDPIGDSGWWIGIDDRWTPTEVDLRRDTLTPGHEVVLSDGAAWVCPVLRAFDKVARTTECRLPMIWGRASGRPQLIVRPEYLALWERSAEFAEIYLRGGRTNYLNCLQFAADCLQINYRIGPDEISMLNLATPDEIDRIGEAACDIPIIDELLREAAENPNSDAPPPG